MDNEKSKKLIYLEKILRMMARSVLKKYQPKIIGITGSVGKTSTKEAVYAVLSGNFRVRRSEKNYNNEIGTPLTILGATSGGRSVTAWAGVFFAWFSLMIFRKKYPEIIVLEMGADRPGDINYLRSFINPRIGIITDVSGSHLEFFKNIEGVAREKGSLVKNLGESSVAVLNVDNSQILKIKNQLKSKTIGFGFGEEADLRATDVVFSYVSLEESLLDPVSFENQIKGLSFKLHFKGTTIPIRLNNILARQGIYAAMAGAAAGIELGLNLVQISEALENFSLPCSRMGLIRGIRNSLLIDDTYNSSPVSASAAISVLGEIRAKRRIAVLGDMLELGEKTESGHIEIAKQFLEIKGNTFFAIGRRMQFAVEYLKQNDFPEEDIHSFSTSPEAISVLREMLDEGDLVLIKGSQGMRMEKIVENIMLEPQKASEILCRQSQDWKDIPVREV